MQGHVFAVNILAEIENERLNRLIITGYGWPKTNVQHAPMRLATLSNIDSVDAIGRNEFDRIIDLEVGSWETDSSPKLTAFYNGTR